MTLDFDCAALLFRSGLFCAISRATAVRIPDVSRELAADDSHPVFFGRLGIENHY